MDTFVTGYISGILSISAIGIFIWTIRRGKGDTTESLKGRIDRNNISTERGFGSLRTNNQATGNLLRRASDTARAGSETISNTNRTVSEIIADSVGSGTKKHD